MTNEPQNRQNDPNPAHLSAPQEPSSTPEPCNQLVSPLAAQPNAIPSAPPPKRKLHSDSVFAKLTPAQHYTLRRWLREHSYTEVLHLVARPAPEGFGILTHINSLYRYFRKHAATEWLFDDMHLPPELLELADRAIHEPSPYHPIASRFIERRLMHFAEDPECNVKGLTDLYKLVLKDKDRKFKEIQFAAKHPEVAALLAPKFSPSPANPNEPSSSAEGDLETIDPAPESVAVEAAAAPDSSPVGMDNSESPADQAATAPSASDPSISISQPQEQLPTTESVANPADANPNLDSDPIQTAMAGGFPRSSTLFHAIQPYSSTASIAAAVQAPGPGLYPRQKAEMLA